MSLTSMERFLEFLAAPLKDGKITPVNKHGHPLSLERLAVPFGCWDQRGQADVRKSRTHSNHANTHENAHELRQEIIRRWFTRGDEPEIYLTGLFPQHDTERTNGIGPRRHPDEFKWLEDLTIMAGISQGNGKNAKISSKTRKGGTPLAFDDIVELGEALEQTGKADSALTGIGLSKKETLNLVKLVELREQFIHSIKKGQIKPEYAELLKFTRAVMTMPGGNDKELVRRIALDAQMETMIQHLNESANLDVNDDAEKPNTIRARRAKKDPDDGITAQLHEIVQLFPAISTSLDKTVGALNREKPSDYVDRAISDFLHGSMKIAREIPALNSYLQLFYGKPTLGEEYGTMFVDALKEEFAREFPEFTADRSKPKPGTGDRWTSIDVYMFERVTTHVHRERNNLIDASVFDLSSTPQTMEQLIKKIEMG